MTDIVDKLVNCERITGWIGAWDERLQVATGDVLPNGGNSVRQDWDIRAPDRVQLVVTHVRRLIVPGTVALRGSVSSRADFPDDLKSVLLGFSDLENDWSSYFPVCEMTDLKSEHNTRAWGAVGLCGEVMGLAVFGREKTDGSVLARVQAVREDVFQRIVGA